MTFALLAKTDSALTKPCDANLPLGENNGTGAYELDLTLLNNNKLAWREMTGLQSDVFCAAGLTLPDKAGRQLTAGGWAGESNFGIRLYVPDGGAGVNGTNQCTCWQRIPSLYHCVSGTSPATLFHIYL